MLLVATTTVAPRFVAAQPRNQVLIASDVHFNPMADANLVDQLNHAEASQWEAILDKSHPRSFIPYGQDTNWWLLKSALAQMYREMPHPAVFMVTGDLLAHSFPKTYQSITQDPDREHYRAFVQKTVQFLAIELRERWPTTMILLTPGNNDNDCGDYSIEENGTFLSDTVEIARGLAKADDKFITDWKSLGSYSVPHPSVDGLQIISINSVFFSNKYHALSFSKNCTPEDSTAARDLLAWLQTQLANAKQANQKVWLMFHIPPGIDGYASTHPPSTSPAYTAATCAQDIVPMWVPSWTASFDELLVANTPPVIANFSGHTHTDDFRVISSNGTSRAFVLIDPPVSPIYGQNPSFRIVDFRNDGTIADQSTYYLTNLASAGRKGKAHWKREYRFLRAWKPQRLDTAGMATIYSQIASTAKARDRWLRFNSVSSTHDPVPPDKVRGLYCAIAALDPDSYRSCACQPTGR